MESRGENIVIDDQLLARNCAAGDNESMSVLIARYQDRVYNIILKICQNPNDALELTQDTFVKVIENINNFKGSSKLFTWIYRIAVNLTLNHCKRRVKLPSESIDADSLESPSSKRALKNYLADSSVDDPSEIAQNQELLEIAELALKSLTDEQKAVIVLRDQQDLSYAQIAEILDIELGTVKSRVSRARDALRSVFKAMINEQ